MLMHCADYITLHVKGVYKPAVTTVLMDLGQCVCPLFFSLPSKLYMYILTHLDYSCESAPLILYTLALTVTY